MSNINSFSQNISQTVANSANTLSMLTAIQKSMSTNDTVTTFDYDDGKGNTIQYQLPSYDAVVNRLKAVEESLNNLVAGKGTVNLNDGSRRSITLSTIPTTPAQITGLADPSTFTIDSNWFFEELMFPGAQVEIDLTGQIDDTSDRVKVVRVILNAQDDDATTFWNTTLASNSYSYPDLRQELTNNGIAYSIDEEVVQMPLVSNQVNGTFQITDDPIVINGNIWYPIDTISYSTIDNDGTNVGQNNILSIGDRLSYSDSIFEIVEIDQNNNRIRIKKVSGAEMPGTFSMLHFYQDPFRNKTLKVRFGAHEYDIIYFKGISENYNLLADEWSTPVKFASDDLVLSGTSGLQQTNFSSYYQQYVVDWGREMIAEAKERRVSAYYGNIPNTPTLNADDFRVVQINTQINAAIDTTDVKNTAAEIESVKSQIASLKSTIAAQKTDLQSAVNLYTYNSIQEQISTNTTDLNNLQTTYTTLVNSFQTIVRENAAITAVPKYHIRGFFPIPDYKFRDEEETSPEIIIGFDIAYRYIKEDDTATQLNTFTYTNTDGSETTGTFTDWILTQSSLKTMKYDNDLQRYVWVDENVADGTETNINQIDIAINKGEKVQIKVRSISEAGYPRNPLRSDWSNVVTVDFPSTLATSNEIADLIKEVNDDALTITINNNLDSAGVTEHLDDTIPNSNSVNGLYFKHQAKNIAYEESTTTDGTTVVNSISLQDKISQLFTKISDNSFNVSTNENAINDIRTEMDEKHSQYEESIASINALDEVQNASINLNTSKIDSIRTDRGYVKTERVIMTNDEGTGKVSVTPMGMNELFVIDSSTTDTTSLVPIHAKDVFIHQNGSLVDSISVTSEIERLNENTSSNLDKINDINVSISRVNDKLTDINNLHTQDVSLLRAEHVELQEEVASFHEKSTNEALFNTMYLGYKFSATATQTPKTKLSTNDATGMLYVYDGQSEEQLGIVNAEDFKIYTNGYLSGNVVSMSEVAEVVTDHDNDINTIQDNIGNINDTLSKISYKVSDQDMQVRGNSMNITGKGTISTVSCTDFEVTNGNALWVANGTNTAQLVDGHFKNIYLHEAGQKSSSALNMLGEIKNASTVITEHEDILNGVGGLTEIHQYVDNEHILKNITEIISETTRTNGLSVEEDNVPMSGATFKAYGSNVILTSNLNGNSDEYAPLVVQDVVLKANANASETRLQDYITNTLTPALEVTNMSKEMFNASAGNASTNLNLHGVTVNSNFNIVQPTNPNSGYQISRMSYFPNANGGNGVYFSDISPNGEERPGSIKCGSLYANQIFYESGNETQSLDSFIRDIVPLDTQTRINEIVNILRSMVTDASLSAHISPTLKQILNQLGNL